MHDVPKALAHRTRRGDGPAEPGRWRERQTLARADVQAGALAGVAILLTALPLWRGPGTGDPPAFRALSPLGGAGLFAVLLYMFAERQRHGMARLMLTAVGLALGAAATTFSFAGQVHAWVLLISYWIPAILSVAASVVLTWAHQGLEKPWENP